MKKKALAILLALAVIFEGQGVVFATQTVAGINNGGNTEEVVLEENMAEDGENVSENEAKAMNEENKEDDSELVFNYIDLDMKLPNKVSRADIATADEIQLNKDSVLPSAYRSDQIDTDGDGNPDKSNLPAMRNQGSYGTCWTFSALGACEASLISKGLATDEINLSESHLAYFFYKKSENVGDLLGNIKGDYNRNLESNYLQQGGSNYYTMWHLASWAGPVSEDADTTFRYEALSENQTTEQGELSSSLQMVNSAENIYGKNAFHLQNCYLISPKDRDTMKYFVMQQGAIGISYYATTGNTAKSYDSKAAGKDTEDEGNYYSNQYTSTNHAVQIVGWDDNYSASKFVTEPEGDGAWLVKNSWGAENSSLGQRGYFWLSYYDTSYQTQPAFVYDCESADNYDHIYQYDGSSINYPFWVSYEAVNLFQANANTGGVERLEAVSIGVSSDTSSDGPINYALEIYVYDEDVSEPELSEDFLAASQSGTFIYEGYHTIELEQPVLLEEGQTYAVLFRFSEGAYMLRDKSLVGGSVGFYTCQSEGQSFFRTSPISSWVDAASYGSTLRIKAFTNDEEGVIPVTGVSLNKNTLALEKGNSETLTATVLPADTTEDQTVTWKSSDETVATVTSDGTVTAVGRGSATITAKCGRKSATCAVAVTVPISSVSLNKSTLALEKGNSETLTATVLPADTTEDKTITWESSDETVATVTSDGTVTAVGGGSATITARCGTKSATCAVTVTVPISSVSLNKNTLSLERGESAILTATVLPTDTTENKTVTWESSDETVATVTSDGTVTAVGVGSATITAKCGRKSATCAVTVVEDTESGNPNTPPTEPTTPETPSTDPTDQDTPPKKPTEPLVEENQDDEEDELEVGTVLESTNAQYQITANDEDERTVEYTKPLTEKATVTIPATVTVDGETFLVTSIEKNAFKNNKKLKKITIGKNIISIGASAFYGCKSLKIITIKSEQLKKVGKKAFKGIHASAKVKVPKKKLDAYKKLLKGKGLPATAKIKK